MGGIPHDEQDCVGEEDSERLSSPSTKPWYLDQRWALTLANRSNAQHQSNIRAPAPLPQMYVSKVWESVWPEGQEAIHS
jgi:hypothetical protein